MKTLLLLLLFISLSLVFYQDLKYRRIHILLPVILFIVSYVESKNNLLFNTTEFIHNIVFFFITLILLVLYMTLKTKTFKNPFANYFGIGDLLFFVSVTPLFATYNYILYFIFAMVFSILFQTFFGKFMKEKTIPLAGLSALFLLLVVTKDFVFNFHKVTLL